MISSPIFGKKASWNSTGSPMKAIQEEKGKEKEKENADEKEKEKQTPESPSQYQLPERKRSKEGEEQNGQPCEVSEALKRENEALKRENEALKKSPPTFPPPARFTPVDGLKDDTSDF